jgi:hypothetical protein
MSLRTRSVLPALAAGLVSGLVVFAPPTALADPPALDDRTPSCAAVLARAAAFPGTVPTSHGLQRVVSDAYVSHLTASEECTSAGD